MGTLHSGDRTSSPARGSFVYKGIAESIFRPHGLEMHLEHPPFTVAGKLLTCRCLYAGAEVLQDLLHTDEGDEIQQSLWQSHKVSRALQSLISFVAGALCHLTCCSVWAHGFATADIFRGC